jgi:tetratricopeptide (TPR) repeat protein
VQGDFTQSTIQLGGSSYSLAHRKTGYFITESDLDGKPWEHHIEYVLGGRRVQQYMTTFPNGSIAVLSPTWDILHKKWISSRDAHNPEESASDPAQLWNKSCYGCHVSGEQKNFDPRQRQYRTQWREMGVSCESCHGPGGDHVASAKLRVHGASPMPVPAAILNPAKLDSARSTMACAECHSLRDIYVDGFPAGANYYDYFMPIMQYREPIDNSDYWPDGRPRRLANEAIGLWQSQCFLKGGATCVTCHSRPHDVDIAHNLQLRGNAICGRCHAAIVANVAVHTHHGGRGPGNSCVECHMPRIVSGLNAGMRDHSISIPVPENTIRHGIPNACNDCHKDKSPDWAAQQMTRWYGDKAGQQFIVRADAFTSAQQNNPESVPALLRILGDESAGPLTRANAAGYLGSFPGDPSAYEAVFRALSDKEPLVRATAELSIRPSAAQREQLAPALALLLSDPIATVRMNAAIALAAIGAARQLPREYRDAFAAAVALYRGRAALNNDDPEQQFAAGQFFYLCGYLDDAIASYRTALLLNPDLPAQYALARTLAEKGDDSQAREILKKIPVNDRQYAAAQQLLAALEAKQQRATTPGAPGSTDAEARFREGLLAFQNRNYGVALKAFDEALAGSSRADWAQTAEIDRAVCLARLSRTAEAEAAMQKLSATEQARKNLDFQLAYVELLYDTGRAQDALKQVDDFIALVPNAPTAYLWRARVLLQLQRVNEAAVSAEQALKLQPELPETHNLLLRIYQMQGRTKEAAQQAEWLREYQQRIELH